MKVTIEQYRMIEENIEEYIYTRDNYGFNLAGIPCAKFGYVLKRESSI